MGASQELRDEKNFFGLLQETKKLFISLAVPVSGIDMLDTDQIILKIGRGCVPPTQRRS